jgi:hypothetical protein
MQSNSIHHVQSLFSNLTVEPNPDPILSSSTSLESLNAAPLSQKNLMKSNRHEIFLRKGGFNISTSPSTVIHKSKPAVKTPEQLGLQFRALDISTSYISNDYFSSRFRPDSFWTEKRIHLLYELVTANAGSPAIHDKIYAAHGDCVPSFLYMFPIFDNAQQNLVVELALIYLNDPLIHERKKGVSLLSLIVAHNAMITRRVRISSLNSIEPNFTKADLLSKGIELAESLLLEKSSLYRLAKFLSSDSNNREKLFKFFDYALHSSGFTDDQKKLLLITILTQVNTVGLTKNQQHLLHSLFYIQPHLVSKLLNHMCSIQGHEEAKIFLLHVCNECLKKFAFTLSEITELLSYIQPILNSVKNERLRESRFSCRYQLGLYAKSLLLHQLVNIDPLRLNRVDRTDRVDFFLCLLRVMSILDLPDPAHRKLQNLMFYDGVPRLLFDRLESLADNEDDKLLFLQSASLFLNRTDIGLDQKREVLYQLIEEKISFIPSSTTKPNSSESPSSELISALILENLSILDERIMHFLKSNGFPLP